MTVGVENAEKFTPDGTGEPSSDAPGGADEPVERGVPSEWSSLAADLSRAPNTRPEWRVHDRTHLEFAVDYALNPDAAQGEFEWEAYFFIPKSLRLNAETYSRQDMDSDP
ncbi:MAG: hypothetical protein KC417_17925, partial [Myxococcales bacterium]|nr:hypothetical protein [Myxococcales bacterium]